MGFKMTYDPGKLEAVSDGTGVDSGNWIGTYLDTDPPGEVEMAGFRLGEGLPGDDIKLGTVKFKCKVTGSSELWLHDQGATVDGFVLMTVGTVLDGDIGTGVFLAKVVPPSINPGVLLLLLSD
jgi:hypothetical protein